jgi:hypothetical protein
MGNDNEQTFTQNEKQTAYIEINSELKNTFIDDLQSQMPLIQEIRQNIPKETTSNTVSKLTSLIHKYALAFLAKLQKQTTDQHQTNQE